jgi:hypothetical protein
VTFGHSEVDLFFVFSSGILGKQNQTKAPKSPYLQNSLLEIAKKNKAGFYEISIFPSRLQPIFTKL